MAVRGVLGFFVAVFVLAVSANTNVVFPEIARERTATRIVSGWEADLGQFPHQFNLRMISPIGAVSSCGGSIIHADWGLTAAHCTAGRESFVIRAGVVNLTLPEIIFETTRFYNHPLYDNSRPAVVQPHDIGLLEFGRTIIFSDFVKPIRIARSATKDRNYDRVQLIASGWGRTWTNGASPENLNWVYLFGDSNQRCSSEYGGSSIIVDSTICASHYNVTSQSTCQGDSGGPLTVIDDDEGLTHIAVTSFVSGTGCHTDFPAGFIRSGYYHDWYTEVTQIDFDWVYEGESSESEENPDVPTPEPEESPESEENPDVPTPEPEESPESEENPDSEEAPEPEESAESEEDVEEQEECLDDDELFKVHVVNN